MSLPKIQTLQTRFDNVCILVVQGTQSTLRNFHCLKNITKKFTLTIATANEAGMKEKAIVTTTATSNASRS